MPKFFLGTHRGIPILFLLAVLCLTRSETGFGAKGKINTTAKSCVVAFSLLVGSTGGYLLHSNGIFDSAPKDVLNERLSKEGVKPDPPIEVKVLAQIHSSFLFGSNEEVRASQLYIFNLLRTSLARNPLVFEEGVTGRLTDSPRNELAAEYRSNSHLTSDQIQEVGRRVGDEAAARSYFRFRKVFPNGLPTPFIFSALSPTQQEEFLSLGAGTVLWANGELSIWPAETVEGNVAAIPYILDFRIFPRLPHERRERAFVIRQNREIEALTRIARVQSTRKSSDPQPEYFLIYGAAHDFERYIGDSFAIRRIPTVPETPEDLRRYRQGN